MSVKKLHTESDTFYYITFTCFLWISLFEITDLYDYIYKCFEILRTKEIYNCGYVLMPNNLHLLSYAANDKEFINNLVGETKRFMAYEIVKRLNKLKRDDLITLMQESVTPHEKAKKKRHSVFQPSADIKEILTEKFIRQKLNYMHKNPVSGIWHLADNYLDYPHSSARFYDLGEEGRCKIYHYRELLEKLMK